jgi:cell wall-associated NlpC family hydrolase
MRQTIFFFAVLVILSPLRAQDIRRGLEIPATEPSQRFEAMVEQMARKIEPDLKGDISRLPVYLDFWKRESVRDPRLFPVDVSMKGTDDGAVVLSGFVEYPQHTLSLQMLLKTLGFKKIRQQIVVVSDQPSTVAGGIVCKPHTFVYDRTGSPRESVTELLFGEPVFILRRVDDQYQYLWVHASDGYVGYVSAGDVNIIDRGAFTEYERSVRTTLRLPCDTRFGTLPAGARVKVDSMNETRAECTGGPLKNFSVPRSAIREPDDLAMMQKIEGAILAAQKLIGTKYVWGGRTADGIDCSGLTQLAYASQGINLPRDADQQAYVGRMVATNWYREGMSRGDLMFFISRRGPISHVAIYLGDNQFVEAADAGVKISSMNPKDPNYEPKREKSFAFARRVIE